MLKALCVCVCVCVSVSVCVSACLSERESERFAYRERGRYIPDGGMMRWVSLER